MADSDDFDLLELLSADHANLRDLASTAELAEATSKHLAVERALLYPLVTKDGVASADEVTEMRSLDRDLEEAIESGDMQKAGASLETHVTVQEALFDLVRENVDRSELIRLGQAVAPAMEMAPTHIHTGLPDHGPLEQAASEMAATIDQAEDRITGHKH